MVKGRFITFEGGEGSGKSTQVRRLAARLAAQHLSVTSTREPGGSPGAEEIRNLLIHGDPERWDALSETLLHYAARRDHVRTLIRPALAQGQWVLSDRFADSTRAYQGYGHGLSLETIDQLYALVVEDCTPDHTFILDVPVEIGLARAADRASGGERYEAMDRSFHERLRQGFLEIAQAEPLRCSVIDASADVDRVEYDIAQVLQAKWDLEAP